MPKRWGILGAGNISISHAIALQRSVHAELVGFADIDAAARARASERFGVPTFATIEQLLDEARPEAVTVALPNEVHVEGAHLAATRGIHVLCEKPLAPSLPECDAMISRCATSRVRLGAILNNRGYAQTRWIRDLVSSGRLGARTFTATLALGRSGRAKRQAGLAGTLLLAAGIHYLDLLRWWFGEIEEVATVRADDDDVSVAALRFVSGVFGIFRTSSVGPQGRPARIEIDGDNGHIVLTGATIERVEGDVGSPPPAADAVPELRFGTGHLVVIDEAAAALERGDAFPVSGEEGRAAVAMCSAVYAAARSTRTKARALS